MYPDITLSANNLALIRGEKLLFKRLSFALSNGEAIQIRGANGTGKTSLLRVLCGILDADQGELNWQGTPLGQVRHEFYPQLCYLGHQLGVKQNLTVLENLEFYSGLRLTEPMCDFQSAIDDVGLAGYAEQLVGHLSQGQMRRVSLARLLIEPASLWILDEPFVALDVAGQAWLAKLLEQHLARRGAIIFTSHQTVPMDAPVTMLDISQAA